MSTEPHKILPHEPVPELEEAIMLLHRLPSDSLSRIHEAMESQNIRFAEAALRTGAITRRELEQALEWARSEAKRTGSSVIQEALRRGAHSQREVVLWQSEEVVPGRELVIAHEPEHPRSEVLRSLRTELLLRLKDARGTSIFAILSPNAADGRSQLIAELAVAFAQLGRKTLLVDADLRRPRQHLLFGADNVFGLAQALASNDSPRLHGVKGMPQMALLTSGQLPPNPAELLSGTRFERLTDEWRRRFEFVLLDTPPTSEFSDGLAVASAAGQVLVLSRAEATSFSAVSEMRRKLEATQAITLGAVLNRF